MVNAALMSKFNDMSKFVDKMNKQNICDAECQRQKKIDSLHTAYKNAQNNVNNAPTEFNLAEKAYWTAKNGSSYYQTNIQEVQFKKEADEKIRGWDSVVQPILTRLTDQIDYYKSQYVYKNNVGSVYDSYSDKLTELQQKVDQTVSKKNVNDRLGYFYDYNTGIMNSIIYYLKIIYWILFAIIVFLLIFKKQFRDLNYYPFIISILVLPFALNSFYIFIMNRFRHFIIDNIYFVFFSTIIIIIGIFQFVSNIPFREQPQ